jgi:hypothetical protein
VYKKFILSGAVVLSSFERVSHPIRTPGGLSTNTGPIASAAWLAARELFPKEPKWHVEIGLFDGAGARLDLEIYAEEWGFRFQHGGRESWIRITDVPFVHGRDDHQLLRTTPPLREIGGLVRELEHRHGLAFDRARAALRTTIADSDDAIRSWIRAL